MIWVKSRTSNADTLVIVEYLYGLASYADKNPCAAIDTKITIYDVLNKDVLLKKKIQSDYLYQRSRTVEEFAENDAAFYKLDIGSAAETIAAFIAIDLGV
jgi:hypothetical protein